jgi:AcrR family transcriptional regulator
MPSVPPAPQPTETEDVIKRRDRRDRRRERSREEILEAARQVLLRNGVAAMTLDAVAREVGVSKPALYYYFSSKDALLFELIFDALRLHAQTVHDAVDAARDGPDALGAVLRETVKSFAPRLEDFRLAFLYGQVSTPGAVHFDAEQFARIRPLNNLLLAGAARKLGEESQGHPNRAGIEPRLMAFLAYLSALGLLTMKGMVESMEDPLIYSDDQLIEGMARIFAAAAEPQDDRG